MDLNTAIAAELERTRRRTLDLLAPVSDDALCRQHSPLMSPLVWDLAHVGNYEDLWLLRALGRPGVGERWDDLYDAFRHPRRERRLLPLLGPSDANRYLADVRHRVLDDLAGRRLDAAEPLTADGYVYGMVIQHEHQHVETMLAAIQLMPPRHDDWSVGARAVNRVGAIPRADDDAEVLVPGGPFVMGTDTEPWAYDNERPAHIVDVAPFFIDVTPVTNRTYLAFVDSGGYADRRWWTEAGWAWRTEAQLSAPEFWARDGSGWVRRRFGCLEPIVLDEPVQHVCWYEADACARFLGKRLPTEAEWEKAASWEVGTGAKRRYPWGDGPPTAHLADLGQQRFGPAPAGCHQAGAAPCGAQDMVGGVWEWTSSDFDAYPGTVAFPYREYSEVFYGTDYKVLRGGSWATDPTATRTTFRNWDYPIRRQIFAGFRCARDAEQPADRTTPTRETTR